jgi:hypothetical protein
MECILKQLPVGTVCEPRLLDFKKYSRRAIRQQSKIDTSLPDAVLRSDHRWIEGRPAKSIQNR